MKSHIPENKELFQVMMPAMFIFTLNYLYIFLVQGTPIIDDAYIFFRYADNWGNGYGPVFNLNEYSEGVSSELWTAILAMGAYFSIDLETFAPVVNLFLGLSCIALLIYTCRFISYSSFRLMALITSILYVLSYGVYLYGVTGMESSLFSVTLMLSVLGIYKGRLSGSYLKAFPFICLLTLARPEAFLYSFVLMAVLSYSVFLEERTIPKRLVYLWLLIVGFTAANFFARYFVYDDFIPLTVHAKGFAKYSLTKFILEGDVRSLKNFVYVIYEGLKYETPILYLGVWTPFFVLIRNRNKEALLPWLMVSCIGVNALVSIMAGGDFFIFKRHMVPVLPLMIMSTAWAVDLLMTRHRDVINKKKAVFALILIVQLVLWVGFFLKPGEIARKHGIKQHFTYLKGFGLLMKGLPEQTVLLTDRAGIMPYFAGINVYVRDLFGLMDRHNAKYGDTFCTSEEGGVCGRTDYVYSFTEPFDVFIYNAKTINHRFVVFCRDNPEVCRDYMFLQKEDWRKEKLFIVADKNHSVFKALKENYHAVPIPVDENMLD